MDIIRDDFPLTIQAQPNPELGMFARSFNKWTVELEQRHLIKNTFGTFVERTIVAGFLTSPEDLQRGGERLRQTVLFATTTDLPHSQRISHRGSSCVVESIFQLGHRHRGHCQGIVDKFIGDAVVALWGSALTATHAWVSM